MKFFLKELHFSHFIHLLKRSDKIYQKIEKMINDLELRGRSKDTIKNSVHILESFSRFYNMPPELLAEHEIINYLDYCIKTKKLCRGTVNTINSTLKFFYVVTLEQSWNDLRIPRLRYATFFRNFININFPINIIVTIFIIFNL